MIPISLRMFASCWTIGMNILLWVPCYYPRSNLCCPGNAAITTLQYCSKWEVVNPRFERGRIETMPFQACLFPPYKEVSWSHQPTDISDLKLFPSGKKEGRKSKVQEATQIICLPANQHKTTAIKSSDAHNYQVCRNKNLLF